MAACWPLQMPPTQKSVLISLADNANDHGVCWPSIPKICQRTCFGRTAVIDAVHWLEAHGYLIADRSNGRRSTYQVVVPGQKDMVRNPVRQTNRFSRWTRSASERKQSVSRIEPVRETDTNHQEPSPEPPQQHCSSAHDLVIPSQLSDRERVVVVDLLHGLDIGISQELLDELSGQIAAGRIRTTPSNFMRALIERARLGQFTPAYGPPIAARRDREEAERQARIKERQARPAPPAPELVKARLSEITALLSRQGDTPC